MRFKSEICFSKKTEEPLTSFDEKYEAEEGANYANKKYGHNLKPYKCKKCGYWHLSPRDRETPNEICHYCTDSNGNNKALYFSRESAERRASIIYEERGLNLIVYNCPYSNGYHLTKG